MKATLIYADVEEIVNEGLSAFVGEIYLDRPDLYHKVETHNFPNNNLNEIAEQLFMDYNVDSGLQCKAGIRSMSVGDVVLFDNGAVFVCSPVGFKQVPYAEKFAVYFKD